MLRTVVVHVGKLIFAGRGTCRGAGFFGRVWGAGSGGRVRDAVKMGGQETLRCGGRKRGGGSAVPCYSGRLPLWAVTPFVARSAPWGEGGMSCSIATFVCIVKCSKPTSLELCACRQLYPLHLQPPVALGVPFVY